MNLADKYRPKCIEDFIGQPKALKQIALVTSRPDFDGEAFWICGPSGTGKSTLAQIIAEQFCDTIDIIELDGEACNVDAVREARKFMDYSTMSGRMRCWIVNEAHGMTPKAVQAWLTAMDPMPRHTIIIFTTTSDDDNLFGEFTGPFSSRCIEISFTNQGLAPAMAARAMEIAELEGLGGRDQKAALRLVQECKNNMRMVLKKISAGALMIDDAVAMAS